MRLGWTSMTVMVLFATAGIPARAQSDFQGATHLVEFHEAPIQYDQRTSRGPVARLQERLDSGEVKLEWDARHGWLPSLLQALGVTPESQMLVFSKTSLQRNYISPANPRALYFNDDIYIGWIPGAPVMEISEVDPEFGGFFYDLEQSRADRPRFRSNSQCLSCHASAKTMGVPGHVVRSVGTDRNGEPELLTAISEMNHRVPLKDRWAGWYVTGTHGEQWHRGNLVGTEELVKHPAAPHQSGNRTNLSGLLDASAYLRPGSDIVALLVHDHQTHMHNFITRLSYETRIMQARYGHIRYLRTQREAFLRYLLFTQEAPLKDAIRGTSGFAEHFEKLGPVDAEGRSLRQLDLRHRLFKYPCSFLIYSPAFDAIPEAMRTEVYERLHAILTGKDESPEFEMISPRNKQAILEILRATKPGLPGYWRKDS